MSVKGKVAVMNVLLYNFASLRPKQVVDFLTGAAFSKLNMNNRIVSLVVLAVIVFLVGGCIPANQTPVITSLRANQTPVITSLRAKQEMIAPLDSCLIECVASDKDEDELVYVWSASEGGITGSNAAVAWTAPEQEGVYDIMVNVIDGRGGEATGTVSITVKKLPPRCGA